MDNDVAYSDRANSVNVTVPVKASSILYRQGYSTSTFHTDDGDGMSTVSVSDILDPLEEVLDRPCDEISTLVCETVSCEEVFACSDVDEVLLYDPWTSSLLHHPRDHTGSKTVQVINGLDHDANDEVVLDAVITDADIETGREPGFRNCSISDTLIIFDWDDTLLPSSWILSRSLDSDSDVFLASKERDLMLNLSERVCVTLEAASALGRVAVVTNAESGWVQLSAARFMPAVLQKLNSLKVSVLSARSAFESSCNPSPISWKAQAFSRLISETFSDIVYSDSTTSNDHSFSTICSEIYPSTEDNNCMLLKSRLPLQRSNTEPAFQKIEDERRTNSCLLDISGISQHNPGQFEECAEQSRTPFGCASYNVLQFGDSESERLALFEATRGMANMRSKSFKFAEHPDPHMLLQEHQLIVYSLASMVQYDGSLDLKITIPPLLES